MAENDASRSLTDLADGIRVAMVTSPAPTGLDARPLTVQRVDDDRVWFLVARDAEWLPAASAGPINVALSTDDRWVSLSGRASLVTDPGAIAELGDPISDAWFHGDHPPAALRVDVEHGDWWASAGGPRVAVELVKAKLTGAEPDTGDRGAVDV
ncbi:MAG TPA: pyridoxamine 5'-phosphate oxidase family protein [Aquihabitans sp.]|nr:pyridoxamine 5'-phosphate oxidase family protein [Aquihabitans sp.]